MKLSACIIVKNEEKRIARCLNSIHQIVDEIILVDTGSSDRTKEIAASKTNVKIYEYAWKDDFSEARNYSLSKATGDWILVIDADEWFDPDEACKIRPILGSASQNINAISSTVINLYGNSGISNSKTIRLFRNIPEIRYKGRIHNQLIIKGDFIWSDIKMNHDGYALEEKEMEIKRKRSLRMMNEELLHNGEDENILFHHARSALYARDYENSIHSAEKLIANIRGRAEKFQWGKDNFQSIFYTWFQGMYSIKQDRLCIPWLHDVMDRDQLYLDGFFALGVACSRNYFHGEARFSFNRYFDLLPRYKSGNIVSPIEMMTIGNELKARKFLDNIAKETLEGSLRIGKSLTYL